MNESKKIIKIKPTGSKKKIKLSNIYTNAILTKKLYVNTKNIGVDLNNIFNQLLKNNYEGKCTVDGYIVPDSIKIITFSAGCVEGNDVSFEIVFECSICNPREGMILNCIAKNITKAGIRAEINDKFNPLIIFIARDHNYQSTKFSDINENDEIKVRIIGHRYELNDKHISVIAEMYLE